jgi:hypothetical protein
MVDCHHGHLVYHVLLLLMEFAASCYRDAFVCIACLLVVAIVIADSFAMCKLMVPAMVAVSSSESLFVVRPAHPLFCAYPPCARYHRKILCLS